MTRAEDEIMNQPFFKVMAFVLTGLVAIAVWVMKVNIEKLDKVSDSQIETKALLKVYAEQNARTEATVRDIRTDVDQLKLSDRVQEERIDALTGRSKK